jgi:3-phosphoshikimate 1-carboxyvinyltransferase
LSCIRPGLGREEGDDLIVASDPWLAGQTLPTRIETYDVHRIAMSFALAARRIVILDPDCVGKTYQDLSRLLGCAALARRGDAAGLSEPRHCRFQALDRAVAAGTRRRRP